MFVLENLGYKNCMCAETNSGALSRGDYVDLYGAEFVRVFHRVQCAKTGAVVSMLFLDLAAALLDLLLDINKV